MTIILFALFFFFRCDDSLLINLPNLYSFLKIPEFNIQDPKLSAPPNMVTHQLTQKPTDNNSRVVSADGKCFVTVDSRFRPGY